MASLDRRTFLAALALAPALPAPVAAAGGPAYAFIAASGRRSAGLIVAGLLAASSPSVDELQIGLIRRRHGYRRALRYMSTDRNKAAFAEAAIDYVTAAKNLRFTALVARGDALPTSSDLQRQLIEDSANTAMVIRLRDGERGGAALRAWIAGRPGLTVDQCGRSNLAELAAFLSGCVYGEASGVANPIKQRLLERLRRQIDPERFSVRVVGA